MRVLVVGGGGREHALCWSIAASPLCDELYCAPGNAGIADLATCVAIMAEDVDRIVEWSVSNRIDFVVVGPEAPLVAGLADRLRAAGIRTFGPSAAAARLEGSKAFTKEFCGRHNIPTAAFGRFTDMEAAKAYVREKGAPIVVKADGLAAGKGVVVAATVDEALSALDVMMGDKAFGDAGAEVVIEECLIGEEASFFAIVDGETALPLAGAQDHKRVGDGDTGPNTGGMGAYSPAPILDDAMAERVMAEIIQPTVDGMKAEGCPFQGVFYAGLMITAEGPKLIEYNVRFGDPECQPLIMRLMSDLLPILIAATEGQLANTSLRWREGSAFCVVMAANGYPGSYKKGTRIKGLERVADLGEDVIVFHAGTSASGDRLFSTGGRVLGVTAYDADPATARNKAYEAIDLIDWPEGFCRRDIGLRAIGRDA